MDFAKDILFIVPQNIKNNVVLEINKDSLNNTKVTTFEEVKNNLYFNYDEKTIYYIMKNYKVNYDLAKAYVDSLYYIEDKQYDNEKLDNLVKLKKDLEQNKILIENKLYKSFLKSKKVIVYGYSKFNLFHNFLF